MVETAGQMPKECKVLITGSSGMLGMDLLKELGRDYEIYGADLIAQSPNRPMAKFYKCDITDKKSILDIVEKVKPDIIIHTAAYTDVDGCESNKEKAYKINSEGTRNIALACKKINSVLLYIGTDFVFDGKKRTPYIESDRPNPLSIYGKSKLNGENFVKKLLKKHFIIRTSWLYGKYGKNFVDIILSKRKSEKILKVVNDQVGSPTYTKDLVKAIHALLDKISGQGPAARGQPHGIYHVSNSGSISWYKYAKEILRLAKSKAKVMPISSNELARPAKRPSLSVLDNSKFIKFTGYKMRLWNDALREYIHDKENCSPSSRATLAT